MSRSLALIYDTETTGLPKWSEPSEHPDQPRVVQLCAELVDRESREVVAAMHSIIKPDGWTVPDEVAAIHGISTAKAEAVGNRIDIVLPMFMEMWERASLRVAHNESFDMRMMRIEIMRCPTREVEQADHWKVGPAFCTMANSTKILNLPPTGKMIATGRKGPKPPNLAEAYQHFTGTPLVNAHNATADTAACRAVYFALMDLEHQRAA